MIVINNYEELLPYQKLKPAKEDVKSKEKIKSKVEYRFEENGELTDVTFNFNARLNDHMSTEQGLDGTSVFPFGFECGVLEYDIVAKDITFNYDVECDNIICNNLTSNGRVVMCRHVTINKDLTCIRFFCENLTCETAHAEVLSVVSINCKKLVARSFGCGEKHYCNISAKNVLCEVKKEVYEENNEPLEFERIEVCDEDNLF